MKLVKESVVLSAKGKKKLKESLDSSRGQWDQAKTAKEFGIYNDLKSLEKDLLGVKYITNVDFDLDGLYDSAQIVVLTDIEEPADLEDYFAVRKALKKELHDVFSDHGYKLDDPIEDNETYIYWVVRKVASNKNESLKESRLNEGLVNVNVDGDTLVDMLDNRLSTWTTDPTTHELYRQMYESYVYGGVFDVGEFSPTTIVDNDWVNYCEVVEPGDEEHNYDRVLELYNENGLSDVSTEDVGFSYIEAAVEKNGEMYFLCRR